MQKVSEQSFCMDICNPPNDFSLPLCIKRVMEVCFLHCIKTIKWFISHNSQ